MTTQISGNVSSPAAVAAANKPVSWATFAPWAGAYAIYAVVMVSFAESEAAADTVTALAWLVTLGAIAYWWTPLMTNLGNAIGKKLI